MLNYAKKLFVVGCFLLAALTVMSAADMKIARDKTALREGPANFYDPIVYLGKDTVVKFIGNAEDDHGWLEVEYNGKRGFISEIALKEVKSKKTSDPFANLDFGDDFGGKKKNKNELSPAAYTAAIKGFAVDYSLRIGGENINLDAVLGLMKFNRKEYRQVMKETKLAYFPKRGELIGNEMSDLSANYEALGLAAAMTVLSNGVIMDREMTKRVNIIANILVRQTCDYDKTYKVFVIKDSEPVAFSCPGGYIFISDTMINALTDYRELVAVLAHEVAHIAVRHGVQDLAIDSARENMDDAFGEIDGMLSEDDKLLSDNLQSEIDNIVQAIKVVHDDKEEFEADKIAVELLRRYKIKSKYLKDALTKLGAMTTAKYPDYKTQFARRLSRIR